MNGFGAVVRGIWPLLLSIGLLMVGNGLLGTLLPLTATDAGYDTGALGMVMSGYYLGFLLGTWVVPRWVGRVGVIRVMAGLAGLASVAVMPHTRFTDPWVWFGLRVVVGFSFAGIYLSAESWLNQAAVNAERGRLMGLYLAICYAAMTLGQGFLLLSEPGNLFLVVVTFFGLGSLPVLFFGREEALFLRPPVSSRLLALAPDAVAGALATGLTNGALLALGPVFARATEAGPALFMAVLLLAAGLGQWPAGVLSDRFSRRSVLMAVTLTGALAAWLALGVEGAFPWRAVPLGLLTFQLYALSVALAQDRLTGEQRLSASAGLVLANGVGAFLGPTLAGWAMAARGVGGLMEFVALVHLLLWGVLVVLTPRSREVSRP